VRSARSRTELPYAVGKPAPVVLAARAGTEEDHGKCRRRRLDARTGVVRSHYRSWDVRDWLYLH
jgi:hypothetical protein